MLSRIILLVISYLLGSIPTGYLLVKYLFTGGEDVRRIGSGGTGATNVMRRAGYKAGLLTYLFDVAKGLGAVMLMRQAAPTDYFWLGAAGLAAMLGHIFPIFLGLRGGKGVATGLGVYLALAPWAALPALALFVVVVYFTRYMSLGSILGAASIPVWTLVYYGWIEPSPHLTALVATSVAAAVLITAKHRENIRRLMKGEESKLGSRVTAAGADRTAVSGGGS